MSDGERQVELDRPLIFQNIQVSKFTQSFSPSGLLFTKQRNSDSRLNIESFHVEDTQEKKNFTLCLYPASNPGASNKQFDLRSCRYGHVLITHRTFT
jgi:hypothetical protein